MRGDPSEDSISDYDGGAGKKKENDERFHIRGFLINDD
jgi:hypothetical protein